MECNSRKTSLQPPTGVGIDDAGSIPYSCGVLSEFGGQRIRIAILKFLAAVVPNPLNNLHV